ncbi:hypothetical protein K2173_021930 [Erythroxylum novogranatense]|uniref:DUF4005 domain-containing protein n=1 Tax=Erythroxylum novogranatense TaxID=1862640 RepID=A0AAV8T2I9_9ROSI|nr:hypothetical protein K2173_021930 [Erythroxylum novogranatense]
MAPTIGKEEKKQQGNKEVSIPPKAPLTDITANAPQESLLVAETGSELDQDHEVSANLPHDGVPVLNAVDNWNAEDICSTGNTERIKLYKAATRVQAAFRGYLDRHAFQTLKGIIGLQALIRGHLVRRQAAATLYSLLLIVKIQALARGQKVRRSAVGIDVRDKCSLEKLQGANCAESSRTKFSIVGEQLKENAFARKLLAAASSGRPICMHCDPGEPNSAWEWLERWTRSHIWEFHQQVKKNVNLKSKNKRENLGVNAKLGKPKTSVVRPSGANIRSSSGHSSSERHKQNLRKISNQPAESSPRHAQNGSEKLKTTLRKTFKSSEKAGERSEVDKNRTKRDVTKVSNIVSSLEVSKRSDSVDKMKDTVLKKSEVDKSSIAPAVDDDAEVMVENPNFDSQAKVAEIGEVSKQQETKHDSRNDDAPNTGEGRASFPLRIEPPENGVSNSGTPKLPSYMAPTKSAKAKLREQVSPRFSLDGYEKSSTARRCSLSSSINDKLTSISPRAQSLVQEAGKGVIKSDKSLASPRDGNGKNLSH